MPISHKSITTVHIHAARSRGFTLIEALVVIGILAFLVAILFPVFQRVRENARASVCLSNYHQMGLAVHMYAQDQDDHTPANGGSFSGLIVDGLPYTQRSYLRMPG